MSTIAEKCEFMRHRVRHNNDWLARSNHLHFQQANSDCEYARSIREDAKLPMKKVAVTMGISQAFLSDLELGKRAWSDSVIDKWKSAMQTLTKDPA